MTTRPNRTRRGYTLIENLFGIFLIAISASIMAATLPIANNNRAGADYRNKALAVAEKEMEAVKNLGYANLTPQAIYNNGLLDSVVLQGNGMYSFTNVEAGAWDSPGKVLPAGKGYVGIAQADMDLRRITILIEWTEKGQARRLMVATLVANY